MPDRSATASLRYLEQLLRAAIAEADGLSKSVAGRVIVPLLGMAMAKGADSLIADVLAPQPGQAAVYEVRRQESGERETITLSGDLNAVAALRIAIKSSREGVGGVRIVGRSAEGVERRALIRVSDGVLEYVFPSGEHYAGPAAGVSAALRDWESTIGEWRAGGSTPNGSRSPAEPVGSGLDRASQADDGDRPPTNRFPTAPEIAEAIQASLMQMTVDINLSEVETVIRRTIEATLAERDLRPGPGGTGGAAFEQDELAAQVATRVVAQIMLAREARGPRPPAAPPAVPTPPLPALALPEPPPGDDLGAIAPALLEVVMNHDRMLSEVAGQVAVGTRIVGAIDQLELRMEELRQQGRTTTTALQTLTEQVGALARGSQTAAERLALSLGSELDQLSDRVQHQLATMQATVKRGVVDRSVLEEMTRISSKVARNEAQLERLARRVDGP